MAVGAILSPAPRSARAQSVTLQPETTDLAVGDQVLDPGTAPPLSNARMAQLVRRKIRYVFVIFNENQSFDHEYGTFPGANNLYSDGLRPRTAADTPGFTQIYRDAAGAMHRVEPFRIGPTENANVGDSVDHSHKGLARKLAVRDGTASMTGFAQQEYDGKTGNVNATPATDARGKQYANLVMSHIDCDTIPLLWRLANRFTLFDNIFATEDTPSTPNAVAMLAGQSGESQWVRHGAAGTTAAMSGTINSIPYSGQGTTVGLPLFDDPNPYWGSQFDTSAAPRAPISPIEKYAPGNIAPNLTFATVLLTLGGGAVKDLMAGDRHPTANQADIQADIPAIFARGTKAVAWGWYQNGYDHEPTDTTPVATHANYVAHHQGPQYFGYLADNVKELPNLHGEGDFFTDVASDALPKDGGVFYIRGGFRNIQGLVPPVQNKAYPRALTETDIATVQAAKAGDDDHPGYADRSISEAMTARVVNAIASKPELWAQSAIIVTYDESDGFYDHVPPRILAHGPDGLPLSRGIRVPLLVISPFARAHVVAHAEGDHNAVIETINAIFDLPALSSLPDEAAALRAGNSAAFNAFGPPGFQQTYLGPRDTNSPITDSLLSGFDPRRLQGTVPILPSSYAMIPDDIVRAVPHFGGNGCAAIGMIPEDRRQGITAPPPANFNPLPSTLARYNSPAPQ